MEFVKSGSMEKSMQDFFWNQIEMILENIEIHILGWRGVSSVVLWGKRSLDPLSGGLSNPH